MTHLIVFSHLRWNFVFQRPQHLLSRLARHYPVLFVEEPIRSDAAAFLERSAPMPGVEVRSLRPHTPIDASGFHDDQLPVLKPLLADHLASQGIDDYVVWFYTPMALPLLSELAPRAIVYDCMDELSAFTNAPRQMRQRETALLKIAHLVLTGGPSLYEAKRTLHPNVLCLPSAVDAEHYANAAAVKRIEPMRRASALQDGVAKPRLGFFGVIDERIDPRLIAEVADADPAWQLVMVGPVVKIDPASLPQRANIHWLGQQPYELLPQLVAGWDVCLMPFALNEATRFISPTKTLEYMAAGKPIVSTGINDVKAMFSDVVRIADDAPAFVDACRAALAEKGHQRTERLADMQACVWRYAWSQTVDAVHRALQDELTVRPAMAQQPAAARQPGWATAVEPQASKRRATAGLSLEPRIQKEPRCLPLPLSEVFCLAASAQHRAFLLEATKAFITEAEMARAPRTGGGAPKVAILWDPNEEHKPSNEEALHRFVEAAPSVGLAAELIGPDALDRLPDYDGLLIRCGTDVAGYSYEFARRAEALGIPVVDDPESILRCTNKVYLRELMSRHRIPEPKTMVVHRENLDQVIPTLGLPCVLKLPDSGFGLDVLKIEAEEQLEGHANRFFAISELLIAQEWLPTGFDWRVGVYDRRPLFVCKYFMAPGHWKIIQTETGQGAVEGETVAVAVGEAPEVVVDTAVRAANLIGRGLYGVDLKQVGDRCVVIEVNDNPNIDAGNEDQVLGSALYREVMGVYARRIAERRLVEGR